MLTHAEISAAEAAAHPLGKEKVRKVRAQQEAFGRMACTMAEAETFIRGKTRLRELVASGEINSFLDGASRRVMVESLFDYLAACNLSSHDPDGRPRRLHGWAHGHEVQRGRRKAGNNAPA